MDEQDSSRSDETGRLTQKRLQNTGYVERRLWNLPLNRDPHVPPPYDSSDLAAFRALREGCADAYQQKLCLDWIIYACGTYDDTWRPGGQEGVRATDYASGKRAIGLAIVKMLNMPPKNAEQGEQG